MILNASSFLSDTLFRDLDPETVKTIIQTAADVALLLDSTGVVRAVFFRSSGLRGELDDAGDWVGRVWRTAMTVESRPKLDAMLADARDRRPIRWRQLNHPASAGMDIAISYAAVPIEHDTSVILLGRDLRQNAALQQRLVETQQHLERDYLALRRTEARYRTLFETARDGIAVLDAPSLRPVELNPAARRMLGRDARRALTRPFHDAFDAAFREPIAEALSAARAGAQPEPVRVTLDGVEMRLSLSGLREEDGWFLLARLSAEDQIASDPAQEPDSASLPTLISLMPDAAVLTDEEGDVVAVNEAFRLLAGLPPDQNVAGEPLSRWIGRDEVDLAVLISNLRQRGTVRLFATVAQSEAGVRTDVEISASRRPGGARGFAFYLRDVGRRPAPTDRTQTGLPRVADNMGALIGRVPLKELVRESTDAIERLCIEGALEMTGNNRASAAEMLGVSRQSLYVKLRRFGLIDPDGPDTP